MKMRLLVCMVCVLFVHCVKAEPAVNDTISDEQSITEVQIDEKKPEPINLPENTLENDIATAIQELALTSDNNTTPEHKPDTKYNASEVFPLDDIEKHLVTTPSYTSTTYQYTPSSLFIDTSSQTPPPTQHPKWPHTDNKDLHPSVRPPTYSDTFPQLINFDLPFKKNSNHKVQFPSSDTDNFNPWSNRPIPLIDSDIPETPNHNPFDPYHSDGVFKVHSSSNSAIPQQWIYKPNYGIPSTSADTYRYTPSKIHESDHSISWTNQGSHCQCPCSSFPEYNLRIPHGFVPNNDESEERDRIASPYASSSQESFNKEPYNPAYVHKYRGSKSSKKY